jgi:hypothetical protein
VPDPSETEAETDAVAALAPHVDRLALCIHPLAGRNADLRAARDARHVPAGSMLVVAARYLAHDALRPGDLAALTRYQPRSWSEANEREHVALGLLLARTDGALAPSDAFRDLARQVLAVQAAAAAELWPDPSDAAAVADHLVTTAMQHDDSGEHPAFRRQVETRPATPHAAALLLAAATELRYLRADAHAAALEAAGVRPKDAIDLTRRWKGFGEPLTTDDGRRRTAIEHDTNRRVAARLATADVNTFLALVEHLPGDDPRPVEDR